MSSQLLLNGMLPPVGGGVLTIGDNHEDVFRVDINILDAIVYECDQQGKNYNVQLAFATLVPILKRYTKQGKEFPFLFKQVIFYLTVHCLKYKKDLDWTQAGVLAFLDGAGVSLSHNFFTRLGRTPTMYLRDIPEPFMSYKGQKNGILGAAIRNLVWQAGDYDVFYDLFGGSGAATLAVDKLSKKCYVYNELNKSVYNLMCIVKDEQLHKTVIKNLERLHEYLVNGGQQYNDVDLQIGLQKVCKVAEKTEQIEKDQGIVAAGLGNMQTRAYAYFSYFMDLADEPETILRDPVEHAIAELFRQHFNMHGVVSRGNVLSRLRTLPGRITSFGDKKMIKKIVAVHRRLKNVTLENKGFSHFFTDGRLRSSGEDKKIKKAIYYADPPYVATSGYSDKVNGVDNFDEEDMKRLIGFLVKSGGHFIFSCRPIGDARSINWTDKKKVQKLEEKDKMIYDTVINVFADYIRNKEVKNLYVLSPEEEYIINGENYGSLKKKIEEHTMVEIMITNFKISPFVDSKYPNTTFHVYRYM